MYLQLYLCSSTQHFCSFLILSFSQPVSVLQFLLTWWIVVLRRFQQVQRALRRLHSCLHEDFLCGAINKCITPYDALIATQFGDILHLLKTVMTKFSSFNPIPGGGELLAKFFSYLKLRSLHPFRAILLVNYSSFIFFACHRSFPHPFIHPTVFPRPSIHSFIMKKAYYGIFIHSS
jgi:hypothetical protein